MTCVKGYARKDNVCSKDSGSAAASAIDGGVAAGAVIGVLALIAAVVGIVLWCRYCKRNGSESVDSSNAGQDKANGSHRGSQDIERNGFATPRDANETDTSGMINETF